jgi:hypothetical protein
MKKEEILSLISNNEGFSVIHGTHRNEDLIPSFMEVINIFDPEKAKELKAKYPEMEKALKDLEENEDTNYFESEESDYILNEVLFDVLDSFAPENYYFGSHPGDGSDFGFWKAEYLD